MRTNLLILTALTCLAGCQGNLADPNNRAGTWKPEHYNDSNLQAMVANPADLDHGHGDGSTIGATAAAAVERLRAGHVKPLPATGLAEIRLVNPAAGAGGAAQ
jgi:hypothetical protein